MRPGERGMALIIVLWSLALLALIGARIAATGRTEAVVARADLDRATLQQAADGAVARAIYGVLAEGRHADGHARTIRIGTRNVEVVVANEAGRINPSLAPPNLMASLLLTLGVPADRATSLALAVSDWHTPGDGRQTHGSKRAQYLAAGLPYGPRDAPYRSLDELGLVLGMTPAILQRLAPHLSVFAEGNVDRTVADDIVNGAIARARGNLLPDTVSEGALPTILHATATATAPDGTRFVRDAVVRIGVAPEIDDPLIEILDWRAGPVIG